MAYQAKTYDEFKTQHEHQRKNKDWEFDVNSYGRHQKMMEFAQRLNSVNNIERIQKRLTELENKWPQLAKDF